MIKVKTKNGRVATSMKGTLPEILADTCLILRGIRDALEKKDADIAKEYERALTQQFAEGLVFCSMDEIRSHIADKLMDQLRQLVEDHGKKPEAAEAPETTEEEHEAE